MPLAINAFLQTFLKLKHNFKQIVSTQTTLQTWGKSCQIVLHEKTRDFQSDFSVTSGLRFVDLRNKRRPI